MSRVDRHLQYSVMGLLGSFWSRVATEDTRSQARALATLAANVPELRRLDVPMQKLSSTRSAMVERVRVPFLDGEFVYVGEDMARAWRQTLGLDDETTLVAVRRDLGTEIPRSHIIHGADGRPLGFGLGHLLTVEEGVGGLGSLDSLYILPIPSDLTPIIIATKFQDRVLLQGIDFETGPGYLVMRESPGELFFAGGFTVLAGMLELRLPYDFTMQVNGPAFGHTFIAAYQKGSVSQGSFEKAAAQACGLLVLEADDTLLMATRLTAEITRYIFQNLGVVDIDYPHAALEPGRDYGKGFLVGNGFRVMSGQTSGWLRRAVGDRTVSVEGVTSVPNLYLPPGMALAYYAEEGDAPHARVHLQGNELSLVAYWALQRQHERLTGLYLADTIGMTAERPRVTVDMHALIETFYGKRLLLVLPELDGAPASYKKRLSEFVLREKPVGSAVLIAEEPTDIPDAGTFEPDGPISGFVVYDPITEIPYGALDYDGFLLAYDNEILAHVGLIDEDDETYGPPPGIPYGALEYDGWLFSYGDEIMAHVDP